MLQDPLSINSASARTPACWRDSDRSVQHSVREAAAGCCSLPRHGDLQWLDDGPDNEAHHLPCVAVTGHFQPFLCPEPRFNRPLVFLLIYLFIFWLARPRFTLIKFHSFTPGGRAPPLQPAAEPLLQAEKSNSHSLQLPDLTKWPFSCDYSPPTSRYGDFNVS